MPCYEGCVTKWLVAAGIALAIAIAVWQWRSHGDAAAPRQGKDPGTAVATGSSTRGPVAPDRVEPTKHVRRLAVEDRRRLADQIAAARERARVSTSSSGGTPATGDDTITLDQVSKTVKQSLEEAIPILAECYAQGSGSAAISGKRAAVLMTMFSDPSVGTVIDTDSMKDPSGMPLEPKLDDCLRTTIESLGLPPLEQGGRLHLQYSFVFD
jgi:hypothetical protein